jgi:hypothetical protein
MHKDRFMRLESAAHLSALAAWEISARNFFLPDLSFLLGYGRGYNDRRGGDISHYRPKRERKADLVKAAARNTRTTEGFFIA